MPTTKQMQSGPYKCAPDLQFQKQWRRSSTLYKNVFIKPKSCDLKRNIHLPDEGILGQVSVAEWKTENLFPSADQAFI